MEKKILLNECIEKLIPKVEEMFKLDSSGHDIDHLKRTMRNALYIQKYEGGDPLIIGIASFLHDIHRIMQNEKGYYVSPFDSLDTVRLLLKELDLTKEQIDSICYAIEYHEEYNWNNKNVSDLNTLILQDADNLDAVGAIGIARTFSYGASHNKTLYDEKIPLIDNNDYNESNASEESSLHHFYHKLFKLEDNMNTKTAKKIAKKRVDFMKEYVKEFLNEWNGNIN